MTVYQLAVLYDRWRLITCPETMTWKYREHERLLSKLPKRYKRNIHYKMSYNPKKKESNGGEN